VTEVRGGSRLAIGNWTWWVWWIVGGLVLVPTMDLFNAGAAGAAALGWTILATTTVRSSLDKIRDPEIAAREARRRERNQL
jgi:hypothetical protein